MASPPYPSFSTSDFITEVHSLCMTSSSVLTYLINKVTLRFNSRTVISVSHIHIWNKCTTPGLV